MGEARKPKLSRRLDMNYDEESTVIDDSDEDPKFNPKVPISESESGDCVESDLGRKRRNEPKKKVKIIEVVTDDESVDIELEIRRRECKEKRRKEMGEPKTIRFSILKILIELEKDVYIIGRNKKSKKLSSKFAEIPPNGGKFCRLCHLAGS